MAAGTRRPFISVEEKPANKKDLVGKKKKAKTKAKPENTGGVELTELVTSGEAMF